MPTTRAAAVLAVAVATTLLGGGAAPGAAAPPELRVLLFTKTAGFRHDSIPTAVRTLREVGARSRIHVDATEGPAVFSDLDRCIDLLIADPHQQEDRLRHGYRAHLDRAGRNRGFLRAFLAAHGFGAPP